MKKFKYRARRTDGQILKGWVEAADSRSAVAILRSREMIVLKLTEPKENFLSELLTHLQRVSQNDIVNFTRQLATMINAGLPLTDSLNSLREQASPAMARVLSEVLNDVRSGSSLYEALSRHPKNFSRIYLALVKSGEAAGTLDRVLKKLADNLEKQRHFQSAVRAAMIYPVIVIIAMIIVGVLMMILVIPKMLSMYIEMKAELPLPTKILIAFSNIINNYWWLVIMVFFGAVYGLMVYKKTPAGQRRLDGLWFKIPVIGSLKEKIILTDLTRTLAMLVGTGVSIIESLNIVAEAANNILFREAILDCAKGVSNGVPLAANLTRYPFFPPIVSQMVAVGEETGKLDEVLERVSSHFEDESDMAVKGLTSAIEPIMIVILGAGVGFLVVAIILPIYNLTSQF